MSMRLRRTLMHENTSANGSQLSAFSFQLSANG
jgi:hypothetical protein